VTRKKARGSFAAGTQREKKPKRCSGGRISKRKKNKKRTKGSQEKYASQQKKTIPFQKVEGQGGNNRKSRKQGPKLRKKQVNPKVCSGSA